MWKAYGKLFWTSVLLIAALEIGLLVLLSSGGCSSPAEWDVPATIEPVVLEAADNLEERAGCELRWPRVKFHDFAPPKHPKFDAWTTARPLQCEIWLGVWSVGLAEHELEHCICRPAGHIDDAGTTVDCPTDRLRGRCRL